MKLAQFEFPKSPSITFLWLHVVVIKYRHQESVESKIMFIDLLPEPVVLGDLISCWVWALAFLERDFIQINVGKDVFFGFERMYSYPLLDP